VREGPRNGCHRQRQDQETKEICGGEIGHARFLVISPGPNDVPTDT